MTYKENLKQNAFKPIKENPIILDFTGCKYLGEIHLLLKEKFGFPVYFFSSPVPFRDGEVHLMHF